MEAIWELIPEGWELPVLTIGILAVLRIVAPSCRWLGNTSPGKWFLMMPKDPDEEFRTCFIKGVELLGILIAVIAIVQEFAVEKPRDRALRQGQLLAQFAELASTTVDLDETVREEMIEMVSPAIRKTVELLAEEDVDMSRMVFPVRTNLRDAHLAGAHLEGAYLEGVYLIDAHLAGAHLAGAYLTGAYLEGAYLIDARLAGAHLEGAYLEGANLTRAHLEGAGLAHAYLTGANLFGANLAHAYLTGANLEGADLFGANLAHAYLTGADLEGADLEGADLLSAYLEGVDLAGASGLTREMLASARPSHPPRSLPEGLSWPFEEGEDGEWRPRPQP